MWQTPLRYSWSKLRYRQVGDPTWIEMFFGEKTKFHEISLQGLIPDASYEYQVSMDGISQWSPARPAFFTTAPDASQTFRAVIYGDSRTRSEVHREVIESIAKNEPDILLHTGDFVEFGMNYEGWDEEFFHPAADLLAYVPLYPVLGNHEYNGEGWMVYYDIFSPPGNEQWYAFSYGCARFVILDSNFNFKPKGEQYTWLVEELQSPGYLDSKWQIVLLHHPPYTSGSHRGDEVPIAEYLVPLFEANGVDLVFSAHNHHFERSFKDGIYYIVTAGGGAWLYNFTNEDLNPYSQVRNKIHHHTTLDFYCSDDYLEFNAWDLDLNLIDGPLRLEWQSED
jgi:3',5'-cyclic AMP phosphodiesterase CpdA